MNNQLSKYRKNYIKRVIEISFLIKFNKKVILSNFGCLT